MSWLRMIKNLLEFGMTIDYVVKKLYLLYKFNIPDFTAEEKISIMANLLHENYYTELNLDTYIANGWITAEEKAAIINEANLL